MIIHPGITPADWSSRLRCFWPRQEKLNQGRWNMDRSGMTWELISLPMGTCFMIYISTTMINGRQGHGIGVCRRCRNIGNARTRARIVFGQRRGYGEENYIGRARTIYLYDWEIETLRIRTGTANSICVVTWIGHVLDWAYRGSS